MSGPSPPRVAIVIVSFNTSEVLSACLASLHDAPPATAHHIVVVDNGSADGTVERIRGRWPAVTILEMGRNAGFAAATNAGIAATTSELVLLLNSDTVVPARSLDRLVAALDADPRSAAAGPRLLDRHGHLELSFGSMITPWHELRQKVLGHGLARRWAPVVRWLARRSQSTFHPDWASAACLLVRRECGDAAGWLDERYFMYFEDVDFCAALRAAGHRILYAPAPEIIHTRGETGRRDAGAVRAAYRRSQLAFYAKHHPRWYGVVRGYLRVRGQLPAGPDEDLPHPGD